MRTLTLSWNPVSLSQVPWDPHPGCRQACVLRRLPLDSLRHDPPHYPGSVLGAGPVSLVCPFVHQIRVGGHELCWGGPPIPPPAGPLRALGHPRALPGCGVMQPRNQGSRLAQGTLQAGGGRADLTLAPGGLGGPGGGKIFALHSGDHLCSPAAALPSDAAK